MVLRYPDHPSPQGKTTSDTDVVEARFVDLVPNSLVVWAVDFVSEDPAYNKPMTMRWEVTATDGGACVEITAEDVPDIVPKVDHAAGMASSLVQLDEYLCQ